MRRLLLKLLPHLVFIALAIGVLLLGILINGEWLPTSGLESAWFYSGLFLLLFTMFYVEPYYAAPRNIMTHSLAVVLVLISLRQELEQVSGAAPWWQMILVYATTMLVLSWLATTLSDESLSPEHPLNKAGSLLKEVTTVAGEARVQYSLVFLLFLPLFHTVSDFSVKLALVFWWFLVLTNPQKRIARFVQEFRYPGKELAEIIGVHSRHVFLAKAYPDAPVLQPLEAVEFSYSVDKYPAAVKVGVVLNSYYLDDQRWLKVLRLGEVSGAARRPNVLFRTDGLVDERFQDIRARFLGVVVERSEIGVIRFELVPGAPEVAEGDLVEVEIADSSVLYQIVNAQTGKEQLEAKNEGGYIRAEAIQLGKWNQAIGCFEKYGWLPEMTAPVLRARPAAIEPDRARYQLGVVPGTGLPVYMDLDLARSHHLAILGITGSGKSFITFDILRQLSKNTKIICVDFTNEYGEKLASLDPLRLLDQEGLEEMERMMAERADASRAATIDLRKRIERRLEDRVKKFIDADEQVALFELPDLSNSTFILEFTQAFLDAAFRYAKANVGNRICIVIEEAHTVIPETTSLGDFGDYSSNKALVNKIGQIALQGRKYGVGFIIIAQRTANVTKTVLTQCNSIICFQAFDETSFRFLENHLGTEVARALPRLKQYHAVAVGKAFPGNVPLIVDLTRDVSAPAPEDAAILEELASEVSAE